MNRSSKRSTVIILFLAVAGLAVVTRAEDKKPEPTTAQYLEQLQVKLDHTAQRVNQPNAEGTSVVGLRGAKQEAASKQLYWKGKKGKTAVTPDEIKAFRAAVEQARAGKEAEAVTALKTFQEKYPKSALLPDVNETLSRLSAAPRP
jgi:TolA-binding protein